MDADEDVEETGGTALTVQLTDAHAGQRLDKALSDELPDLSRARLQALIEQGRVTLNGAPVSRSGKAAPGLYDILIPAPAPAEPEAEAIPLTVLYEDTHLIVVDKPAGMAAHPAPGNEAGTLVNALLAHCAGSLSGVGGVARPGIVHRLDKDTSGVMVAAKSDAAHAGLSALFATHDIERTYIALTRGAPDPARGRIETQIGRSNADRKKMAVLRSGGHGRAYPRRPGLRLRQSGPAGEGRHRRLRPETPGSARRRSGFRPPSHRRNPALRDRSARRHASA